MDKMVLLEIALAAKKAAEQNPTTENLAAAEAALKEYREAVAYDHLYS